MKKTSYIDKRTLNPFFKKTNSTPQDLLDWVEFLMKECSGGYFPCMRGNYYMNKYNISLNKVAEDIVDHIVFLKLNKDCIAGGVWRDFIDGDKQPLFDAIKEFKEKYKL